jgi:hypothetical protein
VGLPRKFEKLNNWAKPSPRFNPIIMHRTITGILRKIREIEASSRGVLLTTTPASSMGVETLRGYNLHTKFSRPSAASGCNSKTRDHKQSSIFVELADAFSCHTRVCTVFLATRKSRTLEFLAFDEKSTFDFFCFICADKASHATSKRGGELSKPRARAAWARCIEKIYGNLRKPARVRCAHIMH